MTDTEVAWHPDVATRVVVARADALPARAADLLHEPALLAVDGHPWSRPLDDLRRYREDRDRAYDSPFSAGRPAGLAAALEPFYADVEALFGRLYGGRYEPVGRGRCWRPAVTRGEPMHFDTSYTPGVTLITAFVNVDTEPREYGVSHTLPWLAAHRAAEVKALHAAAGEAPHPSRTMSVLRRATLDGRGPLAPAAPRHVVKFAPGAVWFFDPKLLSHEVRFGRCAVSYIWHVRPHPDHLPERWVEKFA